MARISLLLFLAFVLVASVWAHPPTHKKTKTHKKTTTFCPSTLSALQTYPGVQISTLIRKKVEATPPNNIQYITLLSPCLVYGEHLVGKRYASVHNTSVMLSKAIVKGKALIGVQGKLAVKLTKSYSAMAKGFLQTIEKVFEISVIYNSDADAKISLKDRISLDKCLIKLKGSIRVYFKVIAACTKKFSLQKKTDVNTDLVALAEDILNYNADVNDGKIFVDFGDVFARAKVAGIFGVKVGGHAGANVGAHVGGKLGAIVGGNAGVKVGGHVGGNVGGKVEGNVGGKIESIVGGNVGVKVGGHAGANVGGNVGGHARGNVGGNVGAHVGGKVGGIVESIVGVKVGGNVGANAGVKVGGNVGANTGVKVGGNVGGLVSGKVGSHAGGNVGAKVGGNVGAKVGGHAGGNVGGNIGGNVGGVFKGILGLGGNVQYDAAGKVKIGGENGFRPLSHPQKKHLD